MAAMARLEQPDPLAVTPGDLSRGYGWNAVLQATSLRLNRDAMARAWLRDFVAVCARDQTPFGGVCSWTTNKEATTLGPLYVSQATGVPVDQVPIVPVTQPYQETVLAWGLWCAGQVGVNAPAGVLPNLLTFVAQVCREPGRSAPWYRTGIDGTRMSPHIDSYYHGAVLAVGVELSLPGVDTWVRDFENGLATAFGAPAGPNFERWRNRWHLLFHTR